MDQEDQIVHQDVSESSTSHRNLAYPLIALLIVCGLVIGYFSQVYFGNNNRTLSQVIKKTEIAPTEKPDADPLKSLVGKQVLFDSLQNFDDMTNEDLPNFTDVRVVEPYEGLTLIMGFGRIALYSVAERKYVKMSDKTLSCATSAGLIGQRLYVGCNSETFAGPHRIFEIDMTTGKIARAYLSTSFIGKKYNAVNLKFCDNGDDTLGQLMGWGLQI
ncbi:MAG: hypothetical protein UZ21_OP11001000251 [Microgenomates bacterium OLB22]|nr:MAG: hypothetical protein UZ21_OP11001000251 [Microgenomates bacterium OLB22]